MRTFCADDPASSSRPRVLRRCSIRGHRRVSGAVGPSTDAPVGGFDTHGARGGRPPGLGRSGVPCASRDTRRTEKPGKRGGCARGGTRRWFGAVFKLGARPTHASEAPGRVRFRTRTEPNPQHRARAGHLPPRHVSAGARRAAERPGTPRDVYLTTHTRPPRHARGELGHGTSPNRGLSIGTGGQGCWEAWDNPRGTRPGIPNYRRWRCCRDASPRLGSGRSPESQRTARTRAELSPAREDVDTHKSTQARSIAAPQSWRSSPPCRSTCGGSRFRRA